MWSRQQRVWPWVRAPTGAFGVQGGFIHPTSCCTAAPSGFSVTPRLAAPRRVFRRAGFIFTCECHSAVSEPNTDNRGHVTLAVRQLTAQPRHTLDQALYFKYPALPVLPLPAACFTYTSEGVGCSSAFPNTEQVMRHSSVVRHTC